MKDKNAKIKVALIAPSMANVGGQSVQAKRLQEAFADDEEIEIMFIPNNPENFAQRIKFLRTVTTSLKFWISLFRQIRQTEIVHIFSSGTTSYIISSLPPLSAAKFYGKKTILHYHTGEAETHLANWKKSLRTMRLFDRIVVPSQFLVDVFSKFGLKATAIFNFVETEKFKSRERKTLKPIFLSNRNFERHYQVADILRAFALIQKNIPNARLLIAGYGSQETILKELAANLKLENVEFIGRVEPDKMPEVYDRADVYLNSSVVDNMPLSIIEAFSSGLPVVTTDAGGIPYLVSHEQTGLLVKTGDFENLSNQAIRLLENQELAEKIILNAKKECEKYVWDNVKDEWRNLYREMVKA